MPSIEGGRRFQVKFQVKGCVKVGITEKEENATCLKKKNKIFDAVKKRNNSKYQLLREGWLSDLDQEIFKWFLILHSRGVAFPALLLKTKDFLASDNC